MGAPSSRSCTCSADCASRSSHSNRPKNSSISSSTGVEDCSSCLRPSGTHRKAASRIGNCDPSMQTHRPQLDATPVHASERRSERGRLETAKLQVEEDTYSSLILGLAAHL